MSKTTFNWPWNFRIQRMRPCHGISGLKNPILSHIFERDAQPQISIINSELLHFLTYWKFIRGSQLPSNGERCQILRPFPA